MKNLPPEEIEALRTKIHLPELAVSLGIKQNKGSKFHCFNSEKHNNGDRNPSLSIQKAHFICFGCGIKGDVFDLLRLKNGLSFPEALKFLNPSLDIKEAKQRQSSHLKRQGATAFIPPPHKKPPRLADDDIHSKLALFQRNLQEDRIAERYLLHRGISLATASRYGLGSIPYGAQWRDFKNTYENGKLLGYGWILFPQTTTTGELTNLYGRRIALDCHSKLRHRKLTGCESTFFNGASAQEEDAIAICEGPFDALSLLEVGIPALAICGRSFDPAAIPASTLFFCLDNDDPGRAARDEYARLAILYGKEVHCLSEDTYRGHKDLNSLLTDLGPEKFRQSILDDYNTGWDDGSQSRYEKATETPSRREEAATQSSWSRDAPRSGVRESRSRKADQEALQGF